MPILRKEKNNKFTTVNNFFIDDARLKLEGKGFLLFMLSKPDDWKFNFTNFKKSLGIGDKAIRSIIKMLEELKYLKRERIQDKNGHYEWNYFVYEEPYDMEPKTNNLPYYPEGQMVRGDIPEGNVYINTELSNDKYDKKKNTTMINDYEQINYSIFTNELIKLKYIEESDINSIVSFEKLFKNYLKEGHNYKELFSAINYIVPRVVSRDFLDENGEKICNKVGYFKNAIDTNFKKLENLSKELYTDDDNFWNDFDLEIKGDDIR